MSTLTFSMLESTRSAFKSVRAHAMRSFLTTLGIIIGVASVISVVSIVQGLSKTVSKQFEGLGANVITINSFTTLTNQLKGNFSRITHEDLEMLKKQVTGVDNVTPLLRAVRHNGLIQYKGKTATTTIIGTISQFQKLKNFYVKKGRFINEADHKSRRHVVLFGASMLKELEVGDEIIGKHLLIGDDWFKVIGIMEEKGDFLGIDRDHFMLIPYGTAQSLNGDQSLLDIQVSMSVNDMSRVKQVKDQITRVLRSRHGLKKEQDDDFTISTAKETQAMLDKLVSSSTLVLSGVVGISLLVGGIGIMNIMLVSVTERTREIGILKALGATRMDILLQFLVEAIVLCLLGGLAGVGLGYVIGEIAVLLMPSMPPPVIPMWAISLSFGFSIFVGVVFGILPAVKAANLAPIDALRYD